MSEKKIPATEIENTAAKTPVQRFKICGAFVAVLIVCVIAGAVFSTISFYNYLGQQLFEERKTHLIEITEKVSEVVSTVIDASWDRVETCAKIVQAVECQDEAEVLDLLETVTEFIDSENSIVMAFDQKAEFYTSEGITGYWSDTGVLLSSNSVNQEVISSMPYKANADTYMFFLQRLSKPQKVGNTGTELTHIALAVELDSLSDVFMVSGFQNSCYTYIINQKGRRLYKQTYSRDFIDGYNIIHALDKFHFIRGGTVAELKQCIEDRKPTALEFDYQGTNYFVASTAVQPEDWQVMLFVPTNVLGANTSALMNRTIEFFGGIALLMVGLFSTIVFVVTTSWNDKKMIRQQEETNLLLSRAAKEARSANEAKSEFLTHMSHDIRTPINGIMGMTEIAIRNIQNPEKVMDCLEKIESSSGHLFSLVNDVLDMSRIESGKTTVNHEPLDIRAVMDHCASIIGGQLLNRDVEFIKDFEAFEHPLLLGDELHLRQILINILGNSVKFVRDGGTIIFRAREISNSDGKILCHFEIEDTGIGMKQEFLNHIWEAFSQEDGANRTHYKGTGLGMAITKQFVDLIGGTIAVESQLNVGSKFTVEIPFEVNENAQVLPPPEQEQEVKLEGMRILLVEDNELNMEIAQFMLEAEGITVTTAENGQAAVNIFRKNPPGTFDAILMDVIMPVMDGLIATRTIRALERPDAAEIPIIAMTANAYEEDIKKTKDSGMNAHLSKPIDVARMLQVLSNFNKVIQYPT